MEEKYLYISYAVVALVVLSLAAWWVLGLSDSRFPTPSTPDSDYFRLIDDFNSHWPELWFEYDKDVFNRRLCCSYYRYIVYRSNMDVIYDSAMCPNWKGRKFFPELESAKKISRSIECVRATATTQAAVTRGNTNNLCELVKEGSYYRLVHVSEYIFEPEVNNRG